MVIITVAMQRTANVHISAAYAQVLPDSFFAVQVQPCISTLAAFYDELRCSKQGFNCTWAAFKQMFMQLDCTIPAEYVFAHDMRVQVLHNKFTA